MGFVDVAAEVSGLHELDPHSASKQQTGAPTAPVSLFFPLFVFVPSLSDEPAVHKEG